MQFRTPILPIHVILTIAIVAMCILLGRLWKKVSFIYGRLEDVRLCGQSDDNPEGQMTSPRAPRKSKLLPQHNSIKQSPNESESQRKELMVEDAVAIWDEWYGEMSEELEHNIDCWLPK